MHDLAKRLLTSHPTPETAHDLPGLGLSLIQAHTQVLEHYRAKTQRGLWHTLPDDGYIHTHLTWHFEQAAQPDAIHQLLRESTAAGHNGWYEACEGLGLTANFVTDVARAWRLAEEGYAEEPLVAIGLQCRYALITASLNSLASNLPPALIAALVQKGHWQPIQGLAYVQQIQQASSRATAMVALAPCLPESLLSEASGADVPDSG